MNPEQNSEKNPEYHDQEMALASGIAAFESKQFSRAVGLLRPLADTGNHEAQYRIAVMAQNGLGMQPNPLLAYHCMRSAAAAGIGPAQHGLGFMLLEGECTTPNAEEAAVWFRKAAEQGLAGSQAMLASLYDQGRGVPKDPTEAARWRRLAGFDET